MFSTNDFKHLCTPAKIYFALSLLSCATALLYGTRAMLVLFKLIFAFIWTIILGWLCSKGYVNVSWFLLLLPYILIVLAMFKIFRSNELNQLIQTAQL